MKIVYGEKLSEADSLLIKRISCNCGITEETARLLFYRNIKSEKEVNDFLSAGKALFLNPYDLSGMAKAVERIEQAKIRKEKVLIYGDYDADGICATAVLFRALSEFGIKAEFTVPEREEGYGLNENKIHAIEKGVPYDLIITVDCGISDKDKIANIIQSGTDVIVTDHHEIPLDLPECVIINPKLDNQKYAFDGLCGAGVAFKLATALIGEKANEYLDFVTLATLADSMEIIGENRCIVKEGLKLFNAKLKLPFKYLLNDGKTITAQTVIYAVAPRVNAGGRMGDAESALKLFTSEDENEIFDLAVKLNTYNAERQTLCDQVYKQAKEVIIKNKLYNDSVILVADAKWQAGVIGIVAARLVEDFLKPVIVFAGNGENLKGSARSIEEINIYDAIASSAKYLLGFGGHSQAAGLTVEESNFENLRRSLCEFVQKNNKSVSKEKTIQVDWEITEKISLKFAKEIERLEPFGLGNKKPQFAISARSLSPSRLKANSPHFSFDANVISVLDFNGEHNVDKLELPVNKTLIVELNYSVFRGNESVKGILKNIVTDYTDTSGLIKPIIRNEISKAAFCDRKGVREINRKEISIHSGYGTLYVLTDPNNLKKYSVPSDIEVVAFGLAEDCNLNTLVISPANIPVGFEKVIYLDTPVNVMQTDAETFVCNEVDGRGILDGIKFDRNTFAEIFTHINKNSGKIFKNAGQYAETVGKDFDYTTFVFATQTFIELKIMSIEHGYAVIDKSVFNPLTNSEIYKKISSLR